MLGKYMLWKKGKQRGERGSPREDGLILNRVGKEGLPEKMINEQRPEDYEAENHSHYLRVDKASQALRITRAKALGHKHSGNLQPPISA